MATGAGTGGDGGGAAGGGGGGECVDLDGDGFGAGAGCAGQDCNDTDPAVHPSAAEQCNGADDNCNGQTDEGLVDLTCGQGICRRTVAACLGGVPQICSPGMPDFELCNGLDDDCNGTVDDGAAGQSLACVTGQSGVCEPGLTQCSGDAGVVCVARVSAGAEACNGLDDNCNGVADEDGPDGGVFCDTGAMGACQSGTTLCADGGISCIALAQPTIERCNGIDDNCDGTSDENSPDAGENCSTGLLGSCALGSTSCDDGGLVCVQLTFPSSESCNGLDDDCNGASDENNPGGNVSCNTGLLGVCAPGATACLDGGVACVANFTASTESCNGLDDNCDGVADDNAPDAGVGCPTGVPGLCAVGATECTLGAITCTQTVTPVLERCNALDDDCDGTSDEGSPDAGLTCATGQQGVCSPGVTSCTSGAILCERTVGPSAEVCDGLDNNCDGATDDGSPGGGAVCVTGQQGVCSPGVTSCTAGAVVCNRNVDPTVETCDGLDNDCNGGIDDGNPGGGVACNTGQFGVCAAGTTSCSGGIIVCNRNVGPSAEVCDGLDNDCDANSDEGNPGSGLSCSTGLQGICGAGTTTCSAGVTQCIQNVSAGAEICDGLDNDCNGAVDNGNPSGGVSCTTGQSGICSAGTSACTAGAVVCNRNNDPTPEVCDGQDNDCNGVIDNGNPGAGAGCATGQAGVCSGGVTSCSGGAIACNRLIAPSGEVCDGLDNDCNGVVDNGNPGGNLSCNTGQAGVCTAGTTACTAGAIACNRNVNPSTETCDGLDNDCNGTVDNGNPGGGLSCSTGQQGVCSGGTTACTAGSVICNRNVGPTAEVCDPFDNNCDGQINEGNPGGGLSCNTGQQGVCSAGTTVCTGNSIACNRNVNPSPEVCDGLDNNCAGGVDDSAVLPDSNPNSCLTAAGRTISVGVNGAVDVSGFLDATGDDYFRVNFTGVGGAGTYFHPKFEFTVNSGNNFRIQLLNLTCGVMANCSGTNNTWESLYPNNPSLCQSYGVCSDAIARPTSVIVRVLRVGGAPLYCGGYTVRSSNQ